MKNSVWKKGLALWIIILLIEVSIISSTSGKDIENENFESFNELKIFPQLNKDKSRTNSEHLIESSSSSNGILGDQLDQYQYEYYSVPEIPYIGYAIYSGQWVAQSFKPGLSTLTSVRLWLFSEGNPGDLIVSIRSSITGEDLVSITKSVEEIPGYWEIEWIEFDFPDISVEVDQTYFIVARCYGGNYDENLYSWIFGYDTSYTRGESWSKKGPDWKIIYDDSDQCFETYGLGDDPGETDYYALIIGYENSEMNEYCINDAIDFYNKLLMFNNWEEDKIIIHTGVLEELNIDLFIDSINEFAKKVDSNDIFVFFYSGHGQSGSNPKIGFNGYIDGEQINDNISKINGKIIIIIDACYSGGLLNLGQNDREIILSTDNGHQGSQTYPPHWFLPTPKNRLFVYMLLKGLNKDWFGYGSKVWADVNEDGDITVKEFFEYGKLRMEYFMEVFNLIYFWRPLLPQEPKMYDTYSGDLILVNYD